MINSIEIWKFHIDYENSTLNSELNQINVLTVQGAAVAQELGNSWVLFDKLQGRRFNPRAKGRGVAERDLESAIRMQLIDI